MPVRGELPHSIMAEIIFKYYLLSWYKIVGVVSVPELGMGFYACC